MGESDGQISNPNLSQRKSDIQNHTPEIIIAV